MATLAAHTERTGPVLHRWQAESDAAVASGESRSGNSPELSARLGRRLGAGSACHSKSAGSRGCAVWRWIPVPLRPTIGAHSRACRFQSGRGRNNCLRRYPPPWIAAATPSVAWRHADSLRDTVHPLCNCSRSRGIAASAEGSIANISRTYTRTWWAARFIPVKGRRRPQ